MDAPGRFWFNPSPFDHCDKVSDTKGFYGTNADTKKIKNCQK